MHPRDLRNFGRLGLDKLKLAQQPADLQQVANAALGFRLFGMPVGLDLKPGRNEGTYIPGVVPHTKLVIDQTGRHFDAHVILAEEGV